MIIFFKRRRKTRLVPVIILICLLSIGYIFQDVLYYYGSRIYYKAVDFYDISKNKNQYKNLKDFNIKIPTNYLVHGIDVSKHQQYIKWDEVSAMKVNEIKLSFSFIKATEGSTFKDKYFKYNWENSKKNNVIRGAYHFYLPNINSRFQARNFIETVNLESGDLPPVLDIEVTGKYSTENMQRGIKNWLTIIEDYYKVKPIIYTNLKFYQKYLTEDIFEEYTFWIAHYNQRELHLDKDIWHFWQHSDKGNVNGIAGPVDFNVFKGTYEELKGLCKK